MKLQQKIQELRQLYNVVAVIDLDGYFAQSDGDRNRWLYSQLYPHYRPAYEANQRIVLTYTQGDRYADQESRSGDFLLALTKQLNVIDISNFFVILLTNDVTIKQSHAWVAENASTDPVPIEVIVYEETIRNRHAYNTTRPLKADWDQLSDREQYLLTESPTFCIYPWIHIHAYPTGETYPCCIGDMNYSLGSCKKNTLREIWNDEPMRDVRQRMLTDQPVAACARCYEQEAAGFMSGRLSANKHHGHHVDRVHETETDGTLDRFELTYWDIRFSNLCNLRCRSCGHIFSSQWFQDQAQLSGPEWKKHNQVLNYAGRFETDAWDQLVEHLDHVEQIYFAGGEPLLMEEHYRILDELVRRERFDVRLIYNTNFTHTDLKGRSVFEYWKLFDSVSVGASLDAAGPRAEYIRKGTDWAVIEQNRRDMLEICPRVDFYISPTLSIMNALHLPDFHRDWVERGLIRAQDLNVNILQDPPHYRIDIATAEYKQLIQQKFNEHLQWLTDQDPLNRATVGFRSAINFMMTTDNSYLLPTFWDKTRQLDEIRRENIFDVIPEIEALKQ
jgi:MoaA/NifB/PqqE/SkfB family radical SAM enzyme